tara:strand:+ start:216 stop:647 length:432 start_codon:yes stop_codon:yes gene_type:complete
MGTLKTDVITGLGSNNEVTFLSNKMTGTASGSITLPGEGGSTTTNLQQGLLKAWADYSTSGTASINGSFNHSGLTDNGTGDTYLNFTNNMANVDYSGWSGGAAISLSYHDDQATNRQRHRAYSDLSSTADGSHRYAGTAGDLA